MKKSSWVEINLDNLKHNLNEIKKNKNKDTRIMAVIKADAYGHGAVELGKFFVRENIDMFGVATLSEALELRQNGIEEDILILGYTDIDAMEEAILNNVILTIYDYYSGVVISSIGKKYNISPRVHIKIDTGMNRLGFKINEESIEQIYNINKLENLKVDGYFTHLATSDEEDKNFSEEQFKKFNYVIDILKEKGLNPKNLHVSNSGAVLDIKKYNLDIIRPGIMLYGYYPSDFVNYNEIKLKYVMSLKSQISNIKWIDIGETVGYGRNFKANKKIKVGTMPIGYGDGFTRLLSGKIEVEIKGSKAKLIGNICMDQSMLDCTDIEELEVGDIVTIFGEGKNNNSADDLAKIIGTINYEILCMISKRVTRVYINRGLVTKNVDYLTKR